MLGLLPKALKNQRFALLRIAILGLNGAPP
jgi:hypothetical protein